MKREENIILVRSACNSGLTVPRSWTRARPAPAAGPRDLATRRADLGQLLERAADRGEISRSRTGLAMDFVYGSMWYRLIFRVGPLDYQWADEVADAIASG